MILVGIAWSLTWLVWLVPWRPAARPLAPVVVATPRPTRLVVGGPVWGAVVAATVLVVHPIPGLVALAVPSWRAWASARRNGAFRERSALRVLPETADLIGLGLAAGLSLRAALHHAVVWIDEPYRSVFGDALRRAEAGETLAAAIDTAAIDLDPGGRPLVALLVAAEADGGSLSNGLRRVGDEARHRRRNTAAARARRLPVSMLLPLVVCVLPAFGLLAVGPLVLTALGDLDLGI